MSEFLGRNEKSGRTKEESEEGDGKIDWTNFWKKARLIRKSQVGNRNRNQERQFLWQSF